jgi:K+-sensing histidine kinase KdpD
VFPQNTQRMLRIFLYGGGSALLALDTFFLIRATFQGNYVPIVPVVAGIFTAGGLLLIVHAEQRAREEDKRNHRRISRVAHQLTHPIEKLQSDLQHLLKNADKLPAEERLKIKHMSTKTSVLLENVRDVFLTLQAQEGNIAQEVENYDLCELVNEALENIKKLASAHNVKIHYKAHCKHASVHVDKHLFLLALNHVIENAIIYTLTPGQVNISITKGNKLARIIIQDRGLGVAKKDIRNVMQPFARGSNSQKYDPNGIGIGLALSRLILRDFNGTIQWKNRPHTAGTQFEIILPLSNLNSKNN